MHECSMCVGWLHTLSGHTLSAQSVLWRLMQQEACASADLTAILDALDTYALLIQCLHVRDCCASVWKC